jgi:hypothetical protein
VAEPALVPVICLFPRDKDLASGLGADSNAGCSL